MKTLIAGGAGEVGRHLARALSRKGQRITIVDRAEQPAWARENPRVHYVRADITDPAVTGEVARNQELVIHLAWSFSDDPQVIYGEDIKGHLNLLDAAAAARARHFIYASTATVYGRTAAHPVTEAHPCLIAQARTPVYALGKFTAEELCNFYHSHRGVPCSIFRFWWAFGDTIGGSHLRELVRKALANEPIELVRGAGGAFVTMADLEAAFALAASKSVAAGQTYNVGSFLFGWEEIIKIIVQITRSNSAIRFVAPEEWHGPAFLNEVWDLDWSKATKELGFRPTASVQAMVAAFTEALRNCAAEVQKS
jgi:UDP-glucose 4-epimerase